MSTIKIPFNQNGELLRNGREYPATPVEWRENFELCDTFEIVDYECGTRNCVDMILKDSQGRKWNVHLREFMKVVASLQDGKIRTTLKFRKVGAYYRAYIAN